jgi:hypothetical protein
VIPIGSMREERHEGIVMKSIALLGAAGVIGLSGLAAAQTVTANPPIITTPSTTGAHDRPSPGNRHDVNTGRRRPSAVESLDAELGTVSPGDPSSRRKKFVRDGTVVGITTARGAEAAATSGATGGSSPSTAAGRSSPSGTAGTTTAGSASSGTSGVTSGSSASSAGAVVRGAVTAAGSNAGGNAGGNSGSKGGKGKK